MDTDDENIIWITRLMEPFINALASNASNVTDWRKAILTEIVETFQSFQTSQKDTAWEMLFKTVILIRLFSGLPHKVLLPLDDEIFGKCIVSYNANINGTLSSWESCDNLSDLLTLVQRPSEYPHVAVYYPPNPKFKVYDMFVIVYESKDDTPQIYGYQLRLGRNQSEKQEAITAKDQCCKRFWIRGEAPKPVMDTSDGKAIWHKATDSEINNCFGASGVNWTPEAWARLTGDNSDHDADEDHRAEEPS